MTTHRGRRVADVIRHAVAELVSREIRDPRVGMVTVTEVRVSPDLKHARVFVTSHGDAEERAASVVALNHAAPFVRRALGRAVRLKYLPDLVFVEDEVLDQGERVESLLREIHAEDPDRDD